MQIALQHLKSLVNIIERMEAILDEVLMRGYKNFSIIVIGRACFPITFNIVEKGMDFV